MSPFARSLDRAINKATRMIAKAGAPRALRRKVLDNLRSPRVNAISLLDVGANVGQTAIAFRTALSSRVKVTTYCFEPFSTNFSKLKENTSALEDVYSFRLGMGSSPDSMDVRLAPHSEWHSIANQEAWNTDNMQTERINISTLDIFTTEYDVQPPIVLKSDTEGYDINVLKGAERLLRSAKIDLICCEVGFNVEDRQHSYFPEIFEYLARFGYRVYSIDDQIPYRHSDWGNVISIGYANAWFAAPALAVVNI
jgi:FkbM family methyltransferase